MVIFGEALFDIFPDGRAVLGGAPFNVAWNLKGVGFDPLLISGVGDDKFGHDILESASKWGLNIDGIQIIKDRPTGIVNVVKGQDGHCFDILPDAAYDFIDKDLALSLLDDEQITILYHGSLALRSSNSKNALWAIRNIHRPATFIDVNLRKPWVNFVDLNLAVTGSNIVKLNIEELENWLHTNFNGRSEQMVESALTVIEQYGLDMMIVSMAEEGAYIISEDRVLHTLAPDVSNFKDSVGAGDAFTSILLASISEKIEIENALKLAVEFASSICSIEGATTTDKDFYRDFKFD